jgi:hypothetical protein
MGMVSAMTVVVAAVVTNAEIKLSALTVAA